MYLKPYDHTTIQEAHVQSLTDLQAIVSSSQNIIIVLKPTKRYMKKFELMYLYCPDCEGQELYRNGKSSTGAQRFRCKKCGHQFVAQYDAIFPERKRREIFEKEFLSNLKPSGFDKVGTGKKKYFEGMRLETLQMLESQTMRVRIDKMIKTIVLQGDRDYRVLLEFAVHEAYGRVMA